MHKILIVDDDKAMCDLLRACLSEGYEVIDTVDPENCPDRQKNYPEFEVTSLNLL